MSAATNLESATAPEDETALAREVAAITCRRLQAEADKLAADWQRARPVQHFLIDDLLPEELTRRVAADFPDPARMRRLTSIREHKCTSGQSASWGMATRACFLGLQAPDVLLAVERITGIRQLSGDATGYAGGVSSMGQGDFLNPHIDNSGHPQFKGYRRLNALFYVTPDWRLEDGGNLELWSNSMRLEDRIEVHSRFNRLVVMNTNRQSLHSVNRVRCERWRLCVSNYYYNPESPSGENYSHITSFRGRPEEPLKDLYLRLEGVLGTAYVRLFPRNVNKS